MLLNQHPINNHQNSIVTRIEITLKYRQMKKSLENARTCEDYEEGSRTT